MRILSLLFFPITFVIRGLLHLLRTALERLFFPKNAWVELTFEGQVLDVAARHPLRVRVMRLLGVKGEEAIVLTRLRRTVDDILKRDRIKLVLVRVGPLAAGWPGTLALRGEIRRLVAGKKKVIAHIKTAAENREYFVASAAEEVWLGPVAPVAVVGAASSGLFLKETLDRIGVRFEVAGVGDYKSAPDMFTRTERSPFDREQAEAIIRTVDQKLLSAIAEKAKVEDPRAIAERGTVAGQAVVDLKLADKVLRDDDIPKALVERFGAIERVDAEDLYRPRPLIPRKKRFVGVVEVNGPIVDRGAAGLGFSDRAAVADEVIDDLRAALHNPRIGAVVVLIDSRGGSVTASDAIYGAVRRLAAQKPVVAYMGDVAASGGYYVACGAPEIHCSPLTITGSIGVFMMLPTWPALAQKLGVHYDVVKELRFAGHHDPWVEPSEAERAQNQAEVTEFYKRFVELVAEARKLPFDVAEAAARGRVYTGELAHERKLVDRLGDLPGAVQRVTELAGGRFAPDPVIVRSRSTPDRPEAVPKALLRMLPPLARELALFSAERRRPIAWSPVDLET